MEIVNVTARGGYDYTPPRSSRPGATGPGTRIRPSGGGSRPRPAANDPGARQSPAPVTEEVKVTAEPANEPSIRNEVRFQDVVGRLGSRLGGIIGLIFYSPRTVTEQQEMQEIQEYYDQVKEQESTIEPTDNATAENPEELTVQEQQPVKTARTEEVVVTAQRVSRGTQVMINPFAQGTANRPGVMHGARLGPGLFDLVQRFEDARPENQPKPEEVPQTLVQPTWVPFSVPGTGMRVTSDPWGRPVYRPNVPFEVPIDPPKPPTEADPQPAEEPETPAEVTAPEPAEVPQRLPQTEIKVEPVQKPDGSPGIRITTRTRPSLRTRENPRQVKRLRPREENRRRKDTKSRDSRLYRAGLYYINKTFGEIDELLDFADAVMGNFYVDGKPLSEWNDPQDALRKALRSKDYGFDFQQFLLDVAANEIEDRVIGKVMEKYGQALREMNIRAGIHA